MVTTDSRPDIYNTYIPENKIDGNTDWENIDPTDVFGYLSNNYREKNVTSIVVVRIDKERPPDAVNNDRFA